MSNGGSAYGSAGGKGAATGQSAVGGPGRGAADRVGVISLGNEFPGA